MSKLAKVFLLFLVLIFICYGLFHFRYGTLESNCKVLVLPPFSINSIAPKFCNNKYIIEFEASKPINGIEPFTYQWSSDSEVETLNNPNVLSAGLHSLTVTDANGCSSISIYEIPDELLVPILKKAVRTEALCEQGVYSVNLEWYQHVYDPYNFESGFELEYYNPNSPVPGFVNRRLYVSNEGSGKSKITEVFASTEHPLKITPYADFRGVGEIICKGPTKTVNVPSFDLPEEYFETTIQIQKKDTENCDTPVGDYILKGYCGSPEGCLIQGDTLGLDDSFIPFGNYTVDIPFVLGFRSFSIHPILESGIQCEEINTFGTNFGAVSMTSLDYNVLNLTEAVWTEAEGCGCYKFELEDDFTSNLTIVSASSFLEVTQNGNTAIACITEKDKGPHCVTVFEMIGEQECERTFCSTEIEIREIEWSELAIYSKMISSGDFIVELDEDTAFPVTWDLGNLENNLSDPSATNPIHLTDLENNDHNDYTLNTPDYSITATDNNGCSTIIEFEIKNCNVLDLILNTVINEGITDPGAERFLTAEPRYQIMDPNSEFALDFLLAQQQLKNLATYEWTGPRNFTSSEQRIFPTVSGRYVLKFKTVCGFPDVAFYDFLAYGD